MKLSPLWFDVGVAEGNQDQAELGRVPSGSDENVPFGI
jgi:hypothetical protein